MGKVPDRIWIRRGHSEAFDGVWNNPVSLAGVAYTKDQMEKGEEEYIRADVADAMVAAAYVEVTRYTNPYAAEKILAYTHTNARAALDRIRKEAVEAERKHLLDVDRLAQIIRQADGSNSFGAGELAEAIAAEIRKRGEKE